MSGSDLIPSDPDARRVTSELLVAGYVPAREVDVTSDMITAGADLVAKEMGLLAAGDGARDVVEMIFRTMMERAPYRALCSSHASPGTR